MSKGNTDPEFTHVQTAACYADADHGLKPSNVFFLQPLLPLNPWRTSGWCRLPVGVLAKRLEQWSHAVLKGCSPGAVFRAAPAATAVGTSLHPDQLALMTQVFCGPDAYDWAQLLCGAQLQSKSCILFLFFSH